jgi:hypothetical protein
MIMDNAEKESPRAKTYLTLVALAVVTRLPLLSSRHFFLEEQILPSQAGS